MAAVLVASGGGCRVFRESGEIATELAGRQVSSLVGEPGGSCLATIDDQEIWRRNVLGAWSQIGKAEIPLQSLASLIDAIFAGGSNEAAMFRVREGGELERLKSFDATPGREEWFAGGPPLG